MTTLYPIVLFPLNRTIIKDPTTSIGMIDIYKVDTFATNPQQSEDHNSLYLTTILIDLSV